MQAAGREKKRVKQTKTMSQQQKIKQFKKILSYILERHPGEFGLIPDEAGYVKIKDLLKALNETDGWRNIRESTIKELLLVDKNPPVEIEDNRIRARQRDHLPQIEPAPEPPKILYTSVRKKAYPHVVEKGIASPDDAGVILSPDSEMAARLGRRKDREAVVLTVHTTRPAGRNIAFRRFTDRLYLADHIPPDIFTGPPLPKTTEKAKKPSPAKPKATQPGAGSFSVTPAMIDAGAGNKTNDKKKKVDWKKDRRQRKKNDRKAWPDEF